MAYSGVFFLLLALHTKHKQLITITRLHQLITITILHQLITITKNQHLNTITELHRKNSLSGATHTYTVHKAIISQRGAAGMLTGHLNSGTTSHTLALGRHTHTFAVPNGPFQGHQSIINGVNLSLNASMLHSNQIHFHCPIILIQSFFPSFRILPINVNLNAVSPQYIHWATNWTTRRSHLHLLPQILQN